MTKFWELLEESVILQATLALVLLFLMVYLVVTRQPIPEIIAASFTFILGFYFGEKGKLELRKLVSPKQ